MVESLGADGQPDGEIRCGVLGGQALPGGGWRATTFAGQCRAYFQKGTRVRLRVTPVQGFAFVGWAGDAAGAQTEAEVVVDADRAVEAQFRVYRPCPAGGR